MDWKALFLQRYTTLRDFWLESFWETVPQVLMRQRPHPRVNSIAWNFWHLARVEDAAVNRFLLDCPQVLDEDDWMTRMNLPWRHHGGGMTLAEVDELSQRISLDALRGYAQAVSVRTLEAVAHLSADDLDEALSEAQVRRVVVDEGLALRDAEGYIANYTGWSKGKTLINLALTHPYQHVGEMGVIATLLGVEFD
ncbi:DinB family protein [Anaerolinea sp.]|uniref:DinB family protein n=1 Tax=Anaerolinea sp. TaxID=1872519 RepID=UPI002ACEF9CC|nr:DinB family protein [Anaerolinea sp.]